MGFFRKEEHTRIIRDEEGHVIGFERTGDRIDSRTPVSDALLKQQPKHESKWPSRLKRIDAAIVNYNRKTRTKSKGGSYSFDSPIMGSFFDIGHERKQGKNTKYIIRGGKAYPIAKTKKKKKSKGLRNRGFDNFFDLRL